MKKHKFVLFALMALVGLMGCSRGASPAVSPQSPTPERTPTATLTAIPPSATSVPVAAIVNGQPILLSEFRSEEARAKAAAASLGMEIAPDKVAKQVLADMVDATLLAQAAYAQGYTPPDDNALWKDAVAEAGGEQKLKAFLKETGYTRAAFLKALRQQRAAAWMARQITSQVPKSAEQVRARQILVYNQTTAEAILNRLRHGEDFTKVAWQYDPYTGGELGWFPRGFLTQHAIEKAAFDLKPGQISGIIRTPLGYHILKVEEREVRPLTPPQRQALQHRALNDWLQKERSHSSIQLLVTPSP